MAIAADPDNIKALNNKGRILCQQGEFESAITAYQQVIDLEPENADAWSAQGLAYLAGQQSERAQSIRPEDPVVWLNRGVVLKKLGKLEQAIADYEQAAIELKFPPAQELLDRLQQRL